MDDSPAPPVSNVPEYTVSEISGAVKRTLEGTFGRVRVRGEITELKRYPSGHIYFSLKDEGGKIAGIVWKSAVSRLGMAPENGVEVVATGRISAYGERSSYQLIVERMEYAGAGALLARIEMLRVRLAAEGLFDAARKRPLPGLPQVIGVVSSERGAVIQDILTTIARRFPRTILLWPVPVQGEGAAERIAAAIEGFQRVVPRPDVLIVARGGGSLEDLMAFNEEVVVRAAAASAIPLISAVGHETDTTLIDFASDRRAPTPTAAAEMAIPARADLIADVEQKAARLVGALNRLTQEGRLRLSRAERGLPDLPSLVGTARQRLDDRAERLDLALPNLVERRRATLAAVERRLPDLPSMLGAARERVQERGVRLVLALPNLVATRRSGVELCGHKLVSCLRHAVGTVRNRANRVLGRLSDAPVRASLREARARLEGTAARLESVSPLAVLQRGYALVTDPAGHPLTSAGAIRPGARLALRFADGEVRATADGARKADMQGELGL
ncbi:MAG: exodeoxyribonuclease VII large subunit [Acetobacteraceae bacterium]|nr:exodeoxyribonuclease VII large subunit [Acetobacteraceae bacterium]